MLYYSYGNVRKVVCWWPSTYLIQGHHNHGYAAKQGNWIFRKIWKELHFSHSLNRFTEFQFGRQMCSFVRGRASQVYLYLHLKHCDEADTFCHLWTQMNLIITSGNIYNLIIMFVHGMSFSEIHNIIRTLDMRASVDLIFSSWHCGFRRVFLNKLPPFLTPLLNTVVSYCQVWDQAVSLFTMMTSSNGNISRVTGPLCGEFPSQRPVVLSFGVLVLWWRHGNVYTMMRLCHTCKSVTFSVPAAFVNAGQYEKMWHNITNWPVI